jgi:glutamyl-tRNA synthetase
LEDVNHAPAFFDVTKLTHMNGEYIRALPAEEFAARCAPWTTGPLAPWPADRFDEQVFLQVAPLVQERVSTLDEVPAMVDFLFRAEPLVDAAAWAAVAGDELAAGLLAAAVDIYQQVEWTAEALHQATLLLAESSGRKLGKAQVPIRVAVTGRRVGPPLFESMVALGRVAVLARLRAAQERLSST